MTRFPADRFDALSWGARHWPAIAYALGQLQLAVAFDWPMHDPQLAGVLLSNGTPTDAVWSYLGPTLLLAGVPEAWL